MAKNRTETRKVELVETHNIALSIERLRNGPHDSNRWRRAIVHALGMNYVDIETQKLVREALKLP